MQRSWKNQHHDTDDELQQLQRKLWDKHRALMDLDQATVLAAVLQQERVKLSRQQAELEELEATTRVEKKNTGKKKKKLGVWEERLQEREASVQ